MTEKNITQKDVEYVAKLARIGISDKEKHQYQSELENILDYIGKLKQKNTDGIQLTTHPHAVTNALREDSAQPFEKIKAVLANAPEREEDFYKVKKVIE